jgi:hypothetical protein
MMTTSKGEKNFPVLNIIGFENTKMGKLPVRAEMLSPSAAQELLKSSRTGQKMNLKGVDAPEGWAGKIHTFRDFVWRVKANSPTQVVLIVPKGCPPELNEALFQEGIMVKESQFSYETVNTAYNKFKTEAQKH